MQRVNKSHFVPKLHKDLSTVLTTGAGIGIRRASLLSSVRAASAFVNEVWGEAAAARPTMMGKGGNAAYPLESAQNPPMKTRNLTQIQARRGVRRRLGERRQVDACNQRNR